MKLKYKTCTSAVVLVCGEGGHTAEMQGFLSSTKAVEQFSGCQVICLSDAALQPTFVRKNWVFDYIGSPTYKHRSYFLLAKIVSHVLRTLWVCFSILCSHKVKLVVCTGPGVCVLPSLIFKLFGSSILFFESVCLFTRRSKTGNIMKFYADKIYVQNQTLLKLYPHGIFCGQLI